MRRFLFCWLIVLLALGAFVPAASAGYSFSVSLTIDNTKVPNVNQTDFSALFCLNGSAAPCNDGALALAALKTVGNGGSVTNSSGFDIVFSASPFCPTLLNWEMVVYTPTTGEVVAWVKIASLLTASPTVIYMCYGNAAIVTFQGNVNGTWNSSYLFEIHGQNVLTDSTSNARDFACVSPGYTAGVFGAAAIRTAATSNSSPKRSDAGLPAGTSDRTIKMWVSWPTNGYVREAWAYGAIGVAEADQRMIQSAFSGGGEVLKYIASGDDITAAFVPTLGQFYHVVLTFNSVGTVAKIYINGSNLATATKNLWNTVLGGTIYIGESPFGTMQIDMQDFAIRNVVEGPDEVTTEWNNQSSPATFYTIGTPVAGGGGRMLLLGVG